MKKWFIVFLLALTVLSISTIVTDTNLVQAAEKTMYVNAKSDIVLREKPEKNAKQIGTVKNKSQVKVISISKGWAYINAGTKKGYVYESALTAKNPATNKTVKGGLLPKDGLKLTYSPDFLSQQKALHTAQKRWRMEPFIYQTITEIRLYMEKIKRALQLHYAHAVGFY